MLENIEWAPRWNGSYRVQRALDQALEDTTYKMTRLKNLIAISSMSPCHSENQML